MLAYLMSLTTFAAIYALMALGLNLMWGIAGITIAVPGLVALKVAAEHSERGQPLVEFLSPGSTRFKAAGRRRRASGAN